MRSSEDEVVALMCNEARMAGKDGKALWFCEAGYSQLESLAQKPFCTLGKLMLPFCTFGQNMLAYM